jgi:hypothetical protein
MKAFMLILFLYLIGVLLVEELEVSMSDEHSSVLKERRKHVSAVPRLKVDKLGLVLIHFSRLDILFAQLA